MVALAQCRPHPQNYQRHDTEQIADLRASLRKFGQVRSIVAQTDGADGFFLVSGHGLTEAARAEGADTAWMAGCNAQPSRSAPKRLARQCARRRQMIETFMVLAVGVATYYSDGLMADVYANRLLLQDVQSCPDCSGRVALNDPRHLGTHIWLDWPGAGISGPYLVTDCAAQADLPTIESRGRVVEVDWPTAQQFGMRGPVAGVRILRFVRPARSGPQQ